MRQQASSAAFYRGSAMDPELTPTQFGPIPTDWRLERVGSVGEVQVGRARSPSTDNGPNMVPYLRVANVLDGWIDYSDVYSMHFSDADQKRFTLRRGDILLNEGQSTELVGRSAIYDGPEGRYCYQNSLVNFRCGPEVDFMFARAVFKRWLDVGHFKSIVKQTTSMAHLGGSRFANLLIPVPKLSEQRRIAEVLETLDDGIRKTEQIVAKLKQVKRGLLHDLLTRGVDDNGQLRDPFRHPHEFKDSPLGRIPKLWSLQSLETATTAPICYGIVQSGTFFAGGPQVLTIGDLARDFRTNIHRTSPQIEQRYARSRTTSGDILLSIKGTIGRVAVVPQWYEGNISRDLARIRVGEHLSPQFLLQYFVSPFGKRRLELAVVGTTRAEISIHVLKQLTVPVPPRAEQAEIAQRLDELDRAIECELAGLSKLRLLRTGLADDLLTGRVRVSPCNDSKAIALKGRQQALAL